MSVLTFDRAFNRAHSTDFLLGSDRFAQPSQRSRRQETTQTVSTKRCSSRLQAVQEKARKGSEVATAAEQPATPQNIFRRAVQALRPSPSEQTEQVSTVHDQETIQEMNSYANTGRQLHHALILLMDQVELQDSALLYYIALRRLYSNCYCPTQMGHTHQQHASTHALADHISVKHG